jgi:hypothetical protein
MTQKEQADVALTASSGEPSLRSRDRVFDLGDRFVNFGSVLLESGDGGAAEKYEYPWLAKKYFGGALDIIIKFEGKTRRDRVYGDDCCAGGRWRKCITYHSSRKTPVWSYDVERRVFCRPENWRYFDVLIRVVQLTELVQVVSPSVDKNLSGLENVFHPLAGCFYSFARGFEADPVLACRESEVAVLRSVIKTNQIPCHMIEGSPQIVDSICYYRGKRVRQFFDKANADVDAASCRIGLDAKSIWFFSDESRELPFDIGNVLIGPVDFLFGAVEHD